MRDATDRVRERFEGETAEHQMTVLRDDGLYRHLRFQKPGTWTYGFDLVTWPGYLAIVGDCGDYVFSRVRDMVEFFEADNGRINPQYWAEKLQAPKPDAAMRYSEQKFTARVAEWLGGRCEELDEAAAAALRQAADDQLLGREHYYEHQAHQLLADFEHDGHYPLQDAWEWSLRDYDWQFLWCCWAIVWGLGQYRANPIPEQEVAHA